MAQDAGVFVPAAASEAAGGDAITAGTSTSGILVFGYGSLIHTPGFEYAAKVEGYIKGWRRVFHQGSTDHRGTPEAPGRTVTLEPCEGCRTYGAAFLLAGDAAQQAETLRYLEWREKQYDVRHRVVVYHLNGGSGTGTKGAAVAGNGMQSAGSVSSNAGGAAAAGASSGSSDAISSSVACISASGGSTSSSDATCFAAAEAVSVSAAAADGQADECVAVSEALVYIASPDTSRNVNYLGPAPLEVIAAQIASAVGPSGPNYAYVYKLADAMRAMGVRDEELEALEARVMALRAALTSQLN